MRKRVGVVLLCAWVIVAGSSGEAAGPRPKCSPPMPEGPTPPLVDVKLELSSTTVGRGEPLGLKLTVRNNGVLPIPYSRGGQTHDFWIRDERGTIWLASQGYGIPDILVRTYLMPGETKIRRGRWTSQCTPDGEGQRRGLPGPGRYVARALWVSDVEEDDGDGESAWWSNEVEFRITR